MEEEIGLDELLDIIIRDKGGTKDDYHRLMNQIAYHETGPVDKSVPDQRMDPAAQQYIYDKKTDKYLPTGTGKGLFMFESHLEYDKEGNPLSTGGNMASNYLGQIFKEEGIEMPEWHRGIWENAKTVDASKLTADQQKMLFLAYHRKHPKSNFSELFSGDLSSDQWWGKYHWAGDDDELATKEDLFRKSMVAYDIYDTEQKKKKEKEEKIKLEMEIKKNSAPYLSNPNRGADKEGGWLSRLLSKYSNIVDKYNDGGKIEELPSYLLPEVEISALTDRSYNRLNQPQRNLYDTFVTPGGIAQTVNIGEDRQMHWKNALRMTKDLGIRNIYNKPTGLKGKLFQKLFARNPNTTQVSADPIFRDITLPKHIRPGNPSYHNPFKWRIDDLKENKKTWVKDQFPTKQDRKDEILKMERINEDKERKKYFRDVIAEYAHIPEFWRMKSLTQKPISFARDFNRLIRGLEVDRSRYADPFHYEHQTHRGPNSFEEQLREKYKTK